MDLVIGDRRHGHGSYDSACDTMRLVVAIAAMPMRIEQKIYTTGADREFRIAARAANPSYLRITDAGVVVGKMPATTPEPSSFALKEV